MGEDAGVGKILLVGRSWWEGFVHLSQFLLELFKDARVQGKPVLGIGAISFAVTWSLLVQQPLLSDETEEFADFSIVSTFKYFIRQDLMISGWISSAAYITLPGLKMDRDFPES